MVEKPKFIPSKKTKLEEPKKKVVAEPTPDLFADAPAPEPPAAPSPEVFESDVAKTERMLNEFMSTQDFKGDAKDMLTGLRGWLYDHCQLKIEGDKESGTFAESIRMGVDVPAACVSAARLEYVMSNLAEGNYSRSVWEKAKREEMEIRKAMGAMMGDSREAKKKEKKGLPFEME